jgi:vacuolar protein sorting-associated protein 52
MYDMVGLLLMIRINYQHRLLMNKRRIPCLDDYLDRVNLQLWPRFKVPASGSICCPSHDDSTILCV